MLNYLNDIRKHRACCWYASCSATVEHKVANSLARNHNAVEYVNDGSIYKRAYNVITLITLLLHVVGIVLAIIALVSLNGASVSNPADISIYQNHLALVIFNNVNRIAMVVLLAIFAYDSANRQLKRDNAAK